MKSDFGALADLRWRLGLWVFCILLVVGGGCALWVMSEVHAQAENATHEDNHAIAESVAQTLAEQFARAVRVGIPLTQLPGVADYLALTLQRQPTLNAIALQQPDGSTLHAVGQLAKGDAVPVPIMVRTSAGSKQTAGLVLVEVRHGAAMQAGLAGVGWVSALAVIGLALLGAIVTAFGPGVQLEAKRRAALALLQQGTGREEQTTEEDTEADALQRLLNVLSLGDDRQRSEQQAVQQYASELLNTDFDGKLRPRVQRILSGHQG